MRLLDALFSGIFSAFCSTEVSRYWVWSTHTYAHTLSHTQEARDLVEGQPPGSYVIRVSKSVAGALAVMFVEADSRNKIRQSLIHAVPPHGLTFRSPPVVYNSLRVRVRTVGVWVCVSVHKWAPCAATGGGVPEPAAAGVRQLARVL